MGHRRRLCIDVTTGEHRQRGSLGPERIVRNRREGAFGGVERRVDGWALHEIRLEGRPRTAQSVIQLVATG